MRRTVEKTQDFFLQLRKTVVMSTMHSATYFLKILAHPYILHPTLSRT